MMKINAQRLLEDFDALSHIGATVEGGVERTAFSQADLEARDWFRQRVEDAGLTFQQDGAGNLSALLTCGRPSAKTLLAGSHLDSVPGGGRYDGPLGVLAALECVRRIQEEKLELPVHVEAISFSDEEGTWLGMLGSRAFAGLLKPQDLTQVKGGSAAFGAALQAASLTADSLLAARRDPGRYAGFIEAHIEQGRRLEKAKLNVGVVTEIVGIRWQWLRFCGEAAHSGTQPMEERKDALWGAARFVDQIRTLTRSYAPGVVNCGQIEARPGAFNIVPSQVKLALEVRHGRPEVLDAMEADLFALARRVAGEFGLQLRVEPVQQVLPARMHRTVVNCIEQAASELGLSHTHLMSFAGHDTQSMSAVMPSAMFFVPCEGGISHNPLELAHEQDIVNAANVMLHALLSMARVMV